MFYLDVDWFNTVNDTHGHDVGDQLLCAVTGRLREHTHPSDILARSVATSSSWSAPTSAPPTTPKQC